MDPYNRLDRDQIPCHWHAVRSGDGIGFRHGGRGVTVEAVEADGPHREFSGRWQLRFRHRVNEAESCRVVGHVTSEFEALSALFSWMERINAAGEDDDAAADVASLGRQVASAVSPQSSTHWTASDQRDGPNGGGGGPPGPGPSSRRLQGGGSPERVRR
jgi:hypothetical protein